MANEIWTGSDGQKWQLSETDPKLVLGIASNEHLSVKLWSNRMCAVGGRAMRGLSTRWEEEVWQHFFGNGAVASTTATATVPEPADEGRKDDQAKVRLDLLPFDAVTAAADVMTWRCTKSAEVPNPYPERNWEKGMNWHRLFRAALGHLWDWWMQKDDGRGPGRDKESGRSHLAHALCCVLFLMAYELRKAGTDDRPLVNK